MTTRIHDDRAEEEANEREIQRIRRAQLKRLAEAGVFGAQPPEPDAGLPSSTQPTPTPWTYGHYSGKRRGFYINSIPALDDADLQFRIANREYEQGEQLQAQADMAHIIRCVNSHAALVAALEDELTALRTWARARDFDLEDIRAGFAISIDKIERVLRQARGE